MSETGLVQILEGALLAAGKAMTVAQLAELFEEQERPEKSAIREALKEVAERCDDRGFELAEVASGFRFQVRQNLSPWVARLWHERPQRYSRALLETLALVAYRQPITRGEIEEIRGVAVSTNIIKTLHEREWIRVVGHRDVPGRPAMYATTKQFLDYFNLKTLDQLPALAEIRDLDTLNAELGFSEPLPEGIGEPKEATPGLTVVGGTEHVPEGIDAGLAQDIDASVDDGADDGEQARAGEQSDAEDTNVNPPHTLSEVANGMSLSEAADALESRAAESFDDELAAPQADPDAAQDQQDPSNATDVESNKPESQS